MDRPLALRADVLDQAADARAEELLPEPVHEDPCRERILRRPTSQRARSSRVSRLASGSGRLRQEVRHGRARRPARSGLASCRAAGRGSRAEASAFVTIV